MQALASSAHCLQHDSSVRHVFTLPILLQVSFVGMTEEQAREKAQEGGWGDKIAVSKTSFKANSKALAEKEGEGIAKLIYRWGPISFLMRNSFCFPSVRGQQQALAEKEGEGIAKLIYRCGSFWFW